MISACAVADRDGHAVFDLDDLLVIRDETRGPRQVLRRAIGVEAADDQVHVALRRVQSERGRLDVDLVGRADDDRLKRRRAAGLRLSLGDARQCDTPRPTSNPRAIRNPSWRVIRPISLANIL